jgi:multidrug resistance efflux pump
LHQRLSQAQDQITANEQLLETQRAQLDSVTEERASLSDLYANGLVTRSRILQLERTATGLQGQIAQTSGNISVGQKSVDEGAVIGRGERLLDIVPDKAPLVVEAKIRVEDIADIAPGMSSEIHFTSYKQRIRPIIHGRVIEVSADRLTDQRTEVPYYVVQVARRSTAPSARGSRSAVCSSQTSL